MALSAPASGSFLCLLLLCYSVLLLYVTLILCRAAEEDINPIAGVGAFPHHTRLHRAGLGTFMHHLQQRFVYYGFYLHKCKSAVRCAPAKLYIT